MLNMLALLVACAAVPTDNPAKSFNSPWTDALPWGTVINIQDMPGTTVTEKLAAAQKALRLKGGGVVFFPAGTYEFSDDILLETGIILRGETSPKINDARNKGYGSPTRFVFPKYVPVFEGEGTPNSTAFKGIKLKEPQTASNCGVVNVSMDHGHINLGGGATMEGKNRLVLGCVLTNSAVADEKIPNRKIEQNAWQRFTARHHAAVNVEVQESALVANNRLPQSGEDNFELKGYVLLGPKKEKMTIPEGVVFDYDNRPGITVNSYALGGSGGNLPDGTPESHPHGFRKGLVIRQNYLFHTGRCSISFSGDGTVCADNVIQFAKDVWRPTATGDVVTSGSSTNDNRAVQMRGWRWRVTGNVYEVYRNKSYNKAYYINDGEGLMHEDHVNSTVKDSLLENNKGNTYISIYKTGGIDGLLIKGNDIRTTDKIESIYVVANRNKSQHLCQNVVIENNITAGSGIRIEGEKGKGNIIRGNKHVGVGIITNGAGAELENNKNYTLK